MKGFGVSNNAEESRGINEKVKFSKEQIINAAINLQNKGELKEAIKYYQFCINQGFNDPVVFSNYGLILINLGQLDKAEIFIRKAIQIKPDFANAYNNLALILKGLGKLDEAEINSRKAINLNPKNVESHLNLGVILQIRGQRDEAEKAFKKAIEIQPDFFQAYLNLGISLQSKGQFNEAEIIIRKAVKIEPNSAEIHSFLGRILIDLGKLKEAEAEIRKAIEINPNLDVSYRNLGICYFILGDKDLAFSNILKANSLNPKNQFNKIFLSIFKGAIDRESKGLELSKNSIKETKSIDNPIIIQRPVPKELIDTLYELKARDQARYQGPTFGDAKGSDYDFFDNNDHRIKKIREDLIAISSSAVGSEILIVDSFYTIFKSGGGLKSHNHLSPVDSIRGLNIANKKFSLVYYLSVGDQNCAQPGILKLEDPQQDFLPSDGMIIIFPAGRNHSVFYKGQKDRVIIGINFYKI